jgi:hypothetical protein
LPLMDIAIFSINRTTFDCKAKRADGENLRRREFRISFS